MVHMPKPSEQIHIYLTETYNQTNLLSKRA